MITISFAKIPFPFPFPCSLGFSLAFDLCPIGIKKKKVKKKKEKVGLMVGSVKESLIRLSKVALIYVCANRVAKGVFQEIFKGGNQRWGWPTPDKRNGMFGGNLMMLS